MFLRWSACFLILLPALVPRLSLGTSTAADEKKDNRPQVLRIGIMATFYRDQPEEIVKTTIGSLKELMLAQTGFDGEPIKVESYEKLGEELAKNNQQLGVFYGHEFAWARKKHAKLRPLVIAVNQAQHLRAYLIIRNDANLSVLEDFQGKSLAIPFHTPEPCYVFLESKCRAAGRKAEQLFTKIVRPANVEVALDDVVDGTVDACLVEEVARNAYQRRKPGRFAKLKEAQKSEVFPAAVVAFRPEYWDKADLEIIKGSLLKAQQNPEGRQLLTLWKLTGFEQVPYDYEKALAKVLKAYPPRNKN